MKTGVRNELRRTRVYILTAVILQVEIANLTIVFGSIGKVPITIPRPVRSTLKSAAIEPLLAKRSTVEPISVSSNCLIGRSRQLHSHPKFTGGSNVIVGPGSENPTPVTSEILTTKDAVPFVTVTKKSFTEVIVNKKKRGISFGTSAIVPRITVCPISCCKMFCIGETQQSQGQPELGKEVEIGLGTGQEIAEGLQFPPLFRPKNNHTPLFIK